MCGFSVALSVTPVTVNEIKIVRTIFARHVYSSYIFVRKLKSRLVTVVEKKNRSASTCKMRSWRLKTAL